jgi:hypothetical protein
MDYSDYQELKIRRVEPGILELVMGEEGGKLSTPRRASLFCAARAAAFPRAAISPWWRK